MCIRDSPITVDRRLEIEHAQGFFKKMNLRRWYAFVDMQTEVARRLKRVITVSENSFKDIHTDHKVDTDRMHIVPVGVDPEMFLPVAGVARKPGMLITTASTIGVRSPALGLRTPEVARTTIRHTARPTRTRPTSRARKPSTANAGRSVTVTRAPACPTGRPAGGTVMGLSLIHI